MDKSDSEFHRRTAEAARIVEASLEIFYEVITRAHLKANVVCMDVTGDCEEIIFKFRGKTIRLRVDIVEDDYLGKMIAQGMDKRPDLTDEFIEYMIGNILSSASRKSV